MFLWYLFSVLGICRWLWSWEGKRLMLFTLCLCLDRSNCSLTALNLYCKTVGKRHVHLLTSHQLLPFWYCSFIKATKQFASLIHYPASIKCNKWERTVFIFLLKRKIALATARQISNFRKQLDASLKGREGKELMYSGNTLMWSVIDILIFIDCFVDSVNGK